MGLTRLDVERIVTLLECWRASERLPAELLDTLPPPGAAAAA